MTAYRKIYKQINLVFLLVSTATFIFTLIAVKGRCLSTCNADFQLAVLNPLLTFSTGLTISLVLMFILRRVVFKLWLWYIASWYLPLSAIMIPSVQSRSDHMLALDRGLAATWWSAGLCLLTVCLIVGCGLYDWSSRKVTHVDL